MTGSPRLAAVATFIVLASNPRAGTAQTAAAAPSTQPSTADTAWYAVLTGPIPLMRTLSGDRSKPGPFRQYYQTPAGTSSGAHRHTADMHIHVIRGRQFILMGDLESAKVQRFDAGSTFVIPAGIWHVEWFEEDTLVEIFGVGPMRTERPPAVPRVSQAAPR